MNIISILTKKRNKERLTSEEVEYLVKEYAKDEISIEQMSALVMAMCINGLSSEELKYFIYSIANNGEKIDMSDVADVYVEKYSIGGVGDKITLILLPILAALDLPAGKLTGKGIGIGGSTADKLMSIPGCRADITIEEFKDNLKEENISITQNILDIAPFEKSLYTIRRKINCMDNLNLIALSILSRKVATGVNKLIINIQCGYGSTIKNYRTGLKLARILMDAGKSAGIEIRCVLSKIYEPLGKSIGNRLEIKEVIDSLNGFMEKDVKELTYEIAENMLIMYGKASSKSEAKDLIDDVIISKKAREKFRKLIEIQNGDSTCITDKSVLGEASFKMEVKARESGYIQMIDAERIGNVAIYLGAGRKTADEEIDYDSGIVLVKKMDDRVSEGDVIAYVYSNDEEKLKGAAINVAESYTIGRKLFSKGSSVLGVMTK